MNAAHNIKTVIIIFLSMAKMLSAMEHDSIQFTGPSLERLRMKDGSRIPDDLENHGWKWIQKEGSAGSLASVPRKGKRSEILLMMTAGLEPGKTYEVFGYFRTSGNVPIQPDMRTCRPVQLGVTLARLQTFDGIMPQMSGMVRSLMVTPGSDVGKFFGYTAEVGKDLPVAGHAVASVGTVETPRLVKARLGYSKASKDGTLPVYFADYPYQDMSGTAWIEGVGVRAVQNDVPIEEGWRNGTRLHLAIRSNDTLTIQREIEATTDLNLLDENGVTSLFYASASRNRELVKAMLDAGANPNRASQFISPLSAAAIQSDVPMAQLLLDGGAEIPLDTPSLPETASKQVHPAFLHPMVVAIRARSLPMVRLLYEKNPAIDLQKILPLDIEKYPSHGSPSTPYPHFIEYASSHDDWEMVEYLLSKGVKIKDAAGMPVGPQDKRLQLTRDEFKLMSRAAAAKRDSVATLDRYLNGWIELNNQNPKGSNPTTPRTEPMDWFQDKSEFDMLHAAIRYGNLDLADRLMRHVRNASYSYQDSLLGVAYTRCKPQAISLIKSHFPEARMRRSHLAALKPSAESDIIAEDARTFLPRTSPYASKQSGENPRHVLAVISSQEGADAAAALASAASLPNEWSVVDRDTSASLLQEMKIGSPLQKGNHDLTTFGDRLAADVIVLVDRASRGKSPLYSYEAIEVATGLAFHRAHVPAERINDPNLLGNFLADVRKQILSCQQNSRREAVTLLGFAADRDTPQQRAVEKLFKARVQFEVDSTPGMISLTRRQTSRIIEEQAMNGTNSIWAASHLVEGGLPTYGSCDHLRCRHHPDSFR